MHFILDQEMHDDLKQAIQRAEMLPEKRVGEISVIPLQLAESAQRS